jgi:hypothetical protein
MTVPPSPAPESRTRFLRIVAAAGLTLVIAGAAIDHVTLSHLAQKTESAAQRSEVGTLRGRLSTAEEQLAVIKRQPDAASQTNLVAARQALDERLDKVEQALEVSARATDLAPLQSRLEQIETRLENAQRTQLLAPTPVRRRATEAAQPKVVEPPFSILGTELRGGESFLSIAPSATQSLIDVRLLHAGERQGDWRLEKLDGKTATFRVDGDVRHITVP